MVHLVIPCYNEALRLDQPAYRRFLASAPGVCLTFVNDGSSDGTLAVLRGLEESFPGQLDVLDLEVNGGKAEAVRQGVCACLDRGAQVVGYWDADLATPLSEVQAFREALEANSAHQLVLGARVKLLGRQIERRPVRHYLGRIFATAASLVLGLPVYDTQCGAKLFRATPAVRAAFAAPFRSRWVFDVEMLARYLVAGGTPEGLVELPLLSWHDVPGSKLRPRDFVKAIRELLAIHFGYRVRGRGREARSGQTPAEWPTTS